MKNIKTLLATAGLVSAMSSLVFAGSWGKDSNGWWYMNDDGTYAKSEWKWIDGNKDGIAECYCFDKKGYLYTDTIVDNAAVNSDGAWVQDGIVQTKQISNSSNLSSSQDQTSSYSGVAGVYYGISGGNIGEDEGLVVELYPNERYYISFTTSSGRTYNSWGNYFVNNGILTFKCDSDSNNYYDEDYAYITNGVFYMPTRDYTAVYDGNDFSYLIY